MLKHKRAQGIYMLGTAWKALEAIPLLEQDLGIPIVYPVTSRVWEIQRRLTICQPIKGYGRILEEMPKWIK